MKVLSTLLSPLLEKGEGILISHIHLSRQILRLSMQSVYTFLLPYFRHKRASSP